MFECLINLRNFPQKLKEQQENEHTPSTPTTDGLHQVRRRRRWGCRQDVYACQLRHKQVSDGICADSFR